MTGVQFERKISLGHIINLLGVLFVVAAAYFQLEKRISINELEVANLARTQEGDIADLKESLRDIKAILEKLRDK